MYRHSHDPRRIIIIVGYFWNRRLVAESRLILSLLLPSPCPLTFDLFQQSFFLNSSYRIALTEPSASTRSTPSPKTIPSYLTLGHNNMTAKPGDNIVIPYEPGSSSCGYCSPQGQRSEERTSFKSGSLHAIRISCDVCLCEVAHIHLLRIISATLLAWD